MHSRTRSLMASLTRTDTNDWLIGLRRGPPVVPVQGEDVERALEVDSRTATVVIAHEEHAPHELNVRNKDVVRVYLCRISFPDIT